MLIVLILMKGKVNVLQRYLGNSKLYIDLFF